MPQMHEDLNLELPAKNIKLLKDIPQSIFAPLTVIPMAITALLPFEFLAVPSPDFPLSCHLKTLGLFKNLFNENTLCEKQVGGSPQKGTDP